MTDDNTRHPNWGGARTGSGRKRQYVRIPIKSHVVTTEPALLTPQSDFTIYTAEMDEDGPRGIMIGDIWYGAEEAQAIAHFIKEHQDWLAARP